MRPQLLSVCCTALLVACASPAAAQSAQMPRFAASGAVGVSRPLDGTMTDVYGTRLVPVTGQFAVHIASGVSAFAGVKWVRSDGRTIVVGAPIDDERYATSLRLMSYRFGVLASARLASRWSIEGGAGICVTSYEETWPDAALAVSGQSTGLVVLGEGRYRVRGKWSAFVRTEYTTVPSKTTVARIDVNLGGVDVSGGLRFSF